MGTKAEVLLDKKQIYQILAGTHIPILFSKKELESLGNELTDVLGDKKIDGLGALATLLKQIDKIYKEHF
tara:strand:- start:614 stop:823 length:210 start_codon:yes stop_codon:yes gene_type:complete